jgi:hypothetical protein
MILSEDQIKQYILHPKNEGLIQYLIKEKEHHELHVVGYGLDEYLTTVDGIEDKEYINVKKKLKNYKTVQLYHKALKPFYNIFTAKGGSMFISSDEEKSKDKIKEFLTSKIGDRYTLQGWMEKIWLSQVNIDPMGMTLLEIDSETQLPYLSYISVYQRKGKEKYLEIHDFDYSDITNVEYLILYWGKDEENNNIYRVIDDEFDYLVKQKASDPKDISIIEEETKLNLFKKVPAIINSNRVDNQVMQAKTSYIKESLIGADDYLNDYTDYRIYKKKISIPRIWEFKTACGTCSGNGYIEASVYKEGQTYLDQKTCPKCNGKTHETKRNLTDIMLIDLLDTGVQNYIPPSGVVTLPTDIQTQMKTELLELEVDIYETIWGQGVFLDNDRANTTAFEVANRNEQKVVQLKEVAKNEKIVEEEIIRLIGKLQFGDAFKNVIIKEPTEYILNTGTEAMALYLEAKGRAAPNAILDSLYTEYLDAKFENNETELIKFSKLFIIEPFPHNTLLEISKDIATDIEFTVKKNFEKYIVRYEVENKTRIYLPENTIEKISTQFNEWAKIENDENTSNTPGEGENDV